MKRYYINKNAQSNGDHEIHTERCSFGALPKDRIDLGYHENDRSALKAGKAVYPNADGCAYCCPSIHKH